MLHLSVVETGRKLLFALRRIMFPVYIFKKKSELYGNKTCLKIWNSAAASLFFWYLYFHMLNDLYICWINKYFEFPEGGEGNINGIEMC